MEATTAHSETLRALAPADHEALAGLARATFPFTQVRFVVPSEAGGVVATVEGRLVAASLLRIVRCPGGRRIGFIAWLMTDPAHRGRGLALRLIEASGALLRARGCDVVAADVEGYNTGSANLFHRAGYRRLTLWQQARLWGPVDAVWMWLRTGFAIDPGFFLWVAGAGTSPPRPWRARLVVLLSNTLLALLAWSLGGGLLLAGEAAWPSASTAAAFLLAVGSLLAAREAAMRAVARRHGTPLEFRAWPGGWALSLLIAAGFGRTFPLPGNLYPPGDGWHTRDHRTVLGQGAVVAALLLAGLVVLGSVVRGATEVAFLAQVAQALLFVGKPLLVFDTLLAVAPFEGFNARHLKAYDRRAWWLLSLLAIVLFAWA